MAVGNGRYTREISERCRGKSAMNEMTTFGTQDFSLQVEDRAESTVAASVDARTLVRLRMTARDTILTSWVDSADGKRSDELEDIPLVDIAHWFATRWTEIVFGLYLLPAIARSVTPAQRWSLSTFGANDERTYEWARSHALEFAATDYALPNVVFQRRDDFMEISWDPRPTANPENTVTFDAKPGSVIVAIDDFVALARGVLVWVVERCDASMNDVRVREIKTLLTRGTARSASQ